MDQNLLNYIDEYIEESLELIETMSNDLMSLENNKDYETYKSIYRAMHTIKGSSMLFGLSKIGILAHNLETCLDQIHKGRLELTSSLTDIILKALDFLKGSVSLYKDKNKITEENILLNDEAKMIISQLLDEMFQFDELEYLKSNWILPSIDMSLEFEALKTFNITTVPTRKAEHFLKIEEESIIVADTSEQLAQNLSSNMNSNKKPTMTAIPKEHHKYKSAEEKTIEKREPQQDAIPPEADPTETYSNETPASESTTQDIKSPQNQKLSDRSKETIKVSMVILDRLLNSVGELVIIRNQIIQEISTLNDSSKINYIAQNLNNLTNNLQTEILNSRMQPLSNLMTKIKRTVRDVSKKMNKLVDLRIEGEHIEIDKSILDEIENPICYILIDSIKYGIEEPNTRTSVGKNPQGYLVIKAFKQGGNVTLQFTDDGAGIDPQMIKKSAIEKNIVSAEEAESMNDQAITKLLLSPGYSTSNQDSDNPGKLTLSEIARSIEKIGGKLDLNSDLQKGTTFTLNLPSTLTIVPSLIVKNHDDRYTIPQVNILELIRVDQSSSEHHIEILNNQPIYRLRGKIVPLISLEKALNSGTTSISNTRDVFNIVILQAGTSNFGLIVDEIDSYVDIVVKPLLPVLKELSKIFAGATILGDGSVALTLDVDGFANQHNMASKTNDLNHNKNESTSSKHSDHNEDYLQIQIGIPGNYAIPVRDIYRLEESSHLQTKCINGNRYLDYSDHLLPIKKVSSTISSSKTSGNGLTIVDKNLSLIVIKNEEKLYGLQVEKFEDIFSASLINDKDFKEPYFKGNTIYNDHITYVLDTDAIVKKIKQLATE